METENRPFKTSRNQKLRTDWKKLKEDVSTLFRHLVLWSIVILMLVLAYWYFIMPEQDKLADEYQISKDKIVIESKPHGCDFDDAPLGAKHCHYEKEVNAIKACEQPSCRVIAVYVSWKKIDD
jgi:hypothetical protein